MKIPSKNQIKSIFNKNIQDTKDSPMLNVIKDAGLEYLKVRIAEGIVSENLTDDSIVTLLGIYLYNRQL